MGRPADRSMAENPRLIHGGVAGFGRNILYGDWPSVEQIAQGVSGAGDGGPLRIGPPIGDLCAGMWIAIGIQAG